MAEEIKSALRTEIVTASSDPRHVFGAGADGLVAPRDPILINQLGSRVLAYRDLERDAKVYACLQQRYDMLVNAPMTIHTGQRRGSFTRREDVRIRDMVAAQVKAMGCSIEPENANAHARFATDFDGALYALMDALLIGFAVAEIMWETDGREIVATELRFRDQRRFVFDWQNNLRLLSTGDEFSGKVLPHRKFVIFTFGSYTDPYGLSLGNRLYYPVKFKRLGISYWLRFLDKYGSPTVLAKYPTERETQRETLLTAAKAVHNNNAVVIHDEEMLELLESIKTAAQQGYEGLNNFLNREISQAILGVTLTTEIGSQGSKAATESHKETQSSKGFTDSMFLMNLIKNTLFRFITDFNSGISTPSPRPQKHFPNVEGLRVLSQVDANLFPMGYKRNLQSVNDVYGMGSEVYEEIVVERNDPPTDATGEDE
jgi:phage gp29-like protein